MIHFCEKTKTIGVQLGYGDVGIAQRYCHSKVIASAVMTGVKKDSKA